MIASNARVLIVGPHPDDETLGAGGTAAKFTAAGADVMVLVVSGHLPPLYPAGVYERTEEEARRAFDILGIRSHRFLKIPATMVADVETHVLNGHIESAVRDFRPDAVLCPYPDRHVDHRVVFESVMVATRPVGAVRVGLVAAYETLSETHWNAPHIEPNFTPNWVVDISATVGVKLDALRCYGSQMQPWPAPRSVEAAEALARFRGSQSGFAAGEAFEIVRMTS